MKELKKPTQVYNDFTIARPILELIMLLHEKKF